MPVKSLAQLNFMRAVVSGKRKAPGLSKEKAQEFIDSTKTTKNLPKKVGSQKSGKVKVWKA